MRRESENKIDVFSLRMAELRRSARTAKRARVRKFLKSVTVSIKGTVPTFVVCDLH